MQDSIVKQLEQRLGAIHARQRLGIESSGAPRVFGGGINFFHPENWYSAHALMRYALKLSGMYWKGRSNAAAIRVQPNVLALTSLPADFDGFTVLHLSDLHIDLSADIAAAIIATVRSLTYDICVLTGDFRAATHGPIEPALAGMEKLCQHLRAPIFGVLGNHDSVRMVPAFEQMGMRMLLNEHVPLQRNDQFIYLAGIDDAHYFRVDNIEKAATAIPYDACSILLSHTPEIYRQAAHAGFSAMLCGHTHGGQICLPGGIPITLDARCPRRMGKGLWRYHNLVGYTSPGTGSCIVDVRINCPPEVTLHTLRVASKDGSRFSPG